MARPPFLAVPAQPAVNRSFFFNYLLALKGEPTFLCFFLYTEKIQDDSFTLIRVAMCAAGVPQVFSQTQHQHPAIPPPPGRGGGVVGKPEFAS